ncbi:MAG: hypothetical protein PHH04_02110 [Thomasclavelia sp.]|jgi:hypothetical protein|nr:hypothetical protein [Thomasclavelia sp.]
MIFKPDEINTNDTTNKSLDSNNFDKRLEHNDLTENAKDNTKQNFDERISGEDKEQIETKELFDLFYNGWDKLSIDNKKDACDALFKEVASELNLNERPELVYKDLVDKDYGEYDFDNNLLLINNQYLNNGVETLKTIIHELRHAWQYQRAELPTSDQTVFDKLLSTNIDCYINPEDNYLAYFIQPMEMDAYKYTEAFIGKMGGEFSE